MNSDIKKIPTLGVGIGLREEIAKETMMNKDSIDVLEIISERYRMESGPRINFLERFANQFPIIPHGVDLSIGAAEDISEKKLKEIKRLSERVGAKYYSDHFALTHLSNLEIGHLSPVWFTKEVMNLVTDKIKKVQDYIGIPLVLENITSDFDIPEADFEEPDFIAEVCEKTGCGLLMDVTNIHINSRNKKLNPIEWVSRFPLDKVVQIHLAGGIMTKDGWYKDAHSENLSGINEGVWEILDYVTKKADIKAIIIERDDNFKGEFGDIIMKDLKRAKEIFSRSKNHLQSSEKVLT